jgi:acetyltransferase-like isoleucine patch superfamily enzyme/glycosyltransferase involved in cell wall biosynthesis
MPITADSLKPPIPSVKVSEIKDVRRVTWLMPVKNGMPYLSETLASIEAQTYTDWEIIVWDNGSTDGTIEELHKWIPAKLPGKVITDEPMSLGDSLARLVEVCESEFCVRIDADDINMPDRLEKQIAFMQDHPEVAVAGSQAKIIDSNGSLVGTSYEVPTCNSDIVNLMLVRNSLAHPTVIFRRSIILEIGNYRHQASWKGVNIEDYDLWLRVSANGHNLANLDASLLHYRVHAKSTTQIAMSENKLAVAISQCIQENSSAYGCQENEMALMLNRKKSSMAIFIKMAQHLSRQHGGTTWSQLTSPSFLGAARQLRAPKDIFSWFILSILDGAFKSKLKTLCKSGLRRLGIIGYILAGKQYINDFLWNRKIANWLKSQHSQGASVHSSIEFKGLRPPFEQIFIGAGCILEKELTIWFSSQIDADPRLIIADRSYIGRNSFLNIFHPITIGKDVLIGPYTYITTANHGFNQREIPIKDQPFYGAPIIIEDDVWIGTHVVVLPGVTIGKGAIIAAHSLVNRDVPPYEVWGGVPARFLKYRPMDRNSDASTLYCN